MGSLATLSPRKRRREELDSFSSLPPSLTSSLSLKGESAASKWSKEIMGAIETHLALLHRHYHHNQHRQHQDYSSAHYPPVFVNDLEGEVCQSSVLNGNNDNGESDDEETGIDTTQLADLMSFRAASLPEGWEQHLDLRMQTGQVFYIHWKSCKRSNVDPRKMVQLANNRILALMHQTREETSHNELRLSMKGEASLSECVTSQSVSATSCIDEDDTEIQSKPTSFCSLLPRAQCPCTKP